MKPLSLDEIVSTQGILTYNSADHKVALNYFDRLLHTAREYHKLKGVLEDIAEGGGGEVLMAREALKDDDEK